MTSIQDAWGVTTLDDRSDTTIKPPTRRTNNPIPSGGVRIIPTASPEPVNTDFIPYTLNKFPVVTNKLPNKIMDEQQLVGLLTLLMIFVLLDKLLTIWKQS